MGTHEDNHCLQRNAVMRTAETSRQTFRDLFDLKKNQTAITELSKQTGLKPQRNTLYQPALAFDPHLQTPIDPFHCEVGGNIYVLTLYSISFTTIIFLSHPLFLLLFAASGILERINQEIILRLKKNKILSQVDEALLLILPPTFPPFQSFEISARWTFNERKRFCLLAPFIFGNNRRLCPSIDLEVREDLKTLFECYTPFLVSMECNRKPFQLEEARAAVAKFVTIKGEKHNYPNYHGCPCYLFSLFPFGLF
jgi:hypothetical protein